jgi:hypothetical protein
MNVAAAIRAVIATVTKPTAADSAIAAGTAEMYATMFIVRRYAALDSQDLGATHSIAPNVGGIAAKPSQTECVKARTTATVATPRSPNEIQ